MIQDSGSRRKFETGAVRDVTEGKEKRRKARNKKVWKDCKKEMSMSTSKEVKLYGFKQTITRAINNKG